MVVVTKIRLGRRGLGILSPLEEDIVNVLWRDNRGYRVRDVHGIVSKRKKVALTSVAVTLDRLHEKKIVGRKVDVGRGGEHYIYFCSCDRKYFQQSVVDKTVNKLIDNYGDVALNYFTERFAKKRAKAS